MSLGSTLGGFNRDEAAKFLSQFASLPAPHSSSVQSSLMLIGLDGCEDGDKVWTAYNDDEQRNERFIRNVLSHANRVLGKEVFRQGEWEHRGKWNDELKRHEQYLIPKKDVWCDGHCLQAGEEVFVIPSYKYGSEQRSKLWHDSGLRPLKEWTTKPHSYGLFPSRQATSQVLTSTPGLHLLAAALPN